MQSQNNSERQKESLTLKIEKMRKLQELALGGVGSNGGAGRAESASSEPANTVNVLGIATPSPRSSLTPTSRLPLSLTVVAAQVADRRGSRPSSRGRQLLYWESLKSKSKETSSMSWRGNDTFAHEMPNHKEEAQQSHSVNAPSSANPRRRSSNNASSPNVAPRRSANAMAQQVYNS